MGKISNYNESKNNNKIEKEICYKCMDEQREACSICNLKIQGLGI